MILDASWMALGAIWDGFWPQVGTQGEAKLAPKSDEMRHQDDVNKSSKIARVCQGAANRRYPGP